MITCRFRAASPLEYREGAAGGIPLTGKVRPGILKIGTRPKNVANFSAFIVADVTISLRASADSAAYSIVRLFDCPAAKAEAATACQRRKDGPELHVSCGPKPTGAEPFPDVPIKRNPNAVGSVPCAVQWHALRDPTRRSAGGCGCAMSGDGSQFSMDEREQT